MPKCTHILRFSFFTYIFSRKIIANSSSPSKTASIDMSFVYFWRKKFFAKILEVSWEYPRQKCHSIFWTEISRFVYQSTQFLMGITNSLLFLVEISTWRMKIVKYECILACNSRHFNNFIRNNCSNYTHKCSFSWALIWYKIFCDIIYTLSCRGGRNDFVTPSTMLKFWYFESYSARMKLCWEKRNIPRESARRALQTGMYPIQNWDSHLGTFPR
jgi:hypothetical protein